jgi:hypothetical protein
MAKPSAVMDASSGCGPQKLDQTYRLPELRERTPLLWGTTDGYQNPCRSFAEVSYALLCTVMQFATDVTAKDNVNSRTWARDTWLRTRWSSIPYLGPAGGGEAGNIAKPN